MRIYITKKLFRQTTTIYDEINFFEDRELSYSSPLTFYKKPIELKRNIVVKQDLWVNRKLDQYTVET